MKGLALFLLLLTLASCTFERRPDRAEDGSREDYSLSFDGEERELEPADSVLRVAQLYREALEVGDLSRALSFLHPGAALYNGAAALLPTGSSAGEVLLQELRLRQEGLHLEVMDSEATILGDAALVLKRYRVTGRDLVGAGAAAGEGADAEAAGEAEDSGISLETIILVRGSDGWRIRHLHRSAIDTY